MEVKKDQVYDSYLRVFVLHLLKKSTLKQGRIIPVVTGKSISSESAILDYIIDPPDVDAVLSELNLTPISALKTEFAATRYKLPYVELAEFGEIFETVVEQNGLSEIWEHLKTLGLDWLTESLNNLHDEVFNNEAEPGDDDLEDLDWAPIPLEYGTNEASAAISAVEKALEAIAQDNGYAATNPAERNSIVLVLKDAVANLKMGMELTYFYAKRSIVVPLVRAAKRFGNSVVGHIIKGALEAIKEWAKDSFSDLLK